MLTATIIQTVFPACNNPAGWATALAPALARFNIDSEARQCSFLAQTGYESAQFNRLVENLNYRTPERLMKVWPKRFPTVDVAEPFVGNERKLANFVYAKRLGNGGAASGDGYTFRGRGIIQITGRSNYAAASVALNLDLVTDPDLLLIPENAAMGAAWYWDSRGLNQLADDRTDDNELEDFIEITRRINGGATGVRDRLALYHDVESAFS